jgi:hypothetical protein
VGSESGKTKGKISWKAAKIRHSTGIAAKEPEKRQKLSNNAEV